jgi:hypothetical protein
MPEAPRDHGTYLIQSKATGKQLALPTHDMDGVFDEQHIIPRDRGAVWEVEFFLAKGFLNCYRFTTPGPFPWFDLENPNSNLGRLDSNHQRQVYAHQRNDDDFQVWQPTPMADGYFVLVNLATGFALDGNSGDIYTHDINSGNFQRWGFFAAPPDPL